MGQNVRVVGVPTEFVCMKSAARTATPDAWYGVNDNGKGLICIIITSAAGSSPSTVPTIDGFDPASGTWYNILTGAAITATGTVKLRVSPTITAATNLIAQDVVPRGIRVVMTHGNSTSHTYTVGLVLTA